MVIFNSYVINYQRLNPIINPIKSLFLWPFSMTLYQRVTTINHQPANFGTLEGTGWDTIFHEGLTLPVTRPGQRLQKTMEKNTMHEAGKIHDISMVIFQMLVITRGYTYIYIYVYIYIHTYVYIYIYVPYRYTGTTSGFFTEEPKIPPAPRFDTSPEDH